MIGEASDKDDMLCSVERDERLEIDRRVERMERDDFMEKAIERVRARNQRIRRLWGVPEVDYPPIDTWRRQGRSSP